MSGIDRSIAIGWEAGKQAGSRASTYSHDNIFIGPRAGQDVRTSNNLFIITGTGNEDRWLESEWSDGAKDHGFQIGNTFTGKSDEGCYRIGATGTLAETQEATLSIKPTISSTPGLQLLPGVSQSAGLLISDAITLNRSAGWEQKGDDIDGEAGDYSGYSVSSSSDGNVVAIGAWGNDDGGSDAGRVRVYVWNGTIWEKRGGDIEGEAASDYSGFSVSLSSDGTIVAIGAHGNDSTGHVRVYQYDATKTTAETDQSSPDFGPVKWRRLGADIDGELSGDASGGSVSLSSDGSIVAIGASDNDGSGSSAGHVRVYQYDVTKTTAQLDESQAGFGPVGWNRLGADIDGEASSDYSGHSVSLSSDGSVVAIGARYNDDGGTNVGHVRVYQYDADKDAEVTDQTASDFGPIGWNRLGADIDGEADDDLSGGSVSLSSDGSIVAIGAFFNDGTGFSNSGHVRVYQYDADKDAEVTDQTASDFGPIGWNRLGADIDGEAGDDFSGRSVSLSSDGSVVAIGAYGNDGVVSAGHVRVYEYKTITETEYNDGNTTNTTGSAGVPVIIDGGVSWGASTKFWVQQGDDIDGESSDLSGWSVSLSSDGNVVTIGAHLDDDGGTDAGRVRVYQPILSFVDSSIVNNNGLLIAADRSRSQVPASTNKGSLILDSTLSTPRLYYSNGTDWVDPVGKVDASGMAVSGWAQGSIGSFLVNNANDTTTHTLTAANYKVANDGNIGSVTTSDAITISSEGAVSLGYAMKEVIDEPSNVANVFTLDMNKANFHTIDLTASTSHEIKVSNVAVGQRFVLRIKQPSSTGNGTVTWNAASFPKINWCDNTEPTIGSTAGHITLIGFVKVAESTDEYDGILIAADLYS
jgi:hypothetical protein